MEPGALAPTDHQRALLAGRAEAASAFGMRMLTGGRLRADSRPNVEAGTGEARVLCAETSREGSTDARR